MKHNTKLHRWIASGLALAGSTGLCLATDISHSFASDVQGWYAADGHGSVVWDATHGRGGGGCLKYTIVAGTDSEIDPRVDVAFDTTGYFSVEFDMMVDASSGTDANGSYGNLQIIARNASWSWDNMWYGAIGTSFNSYQHVKKAFTSAYGLKAYLQIQFAASAAPYSSDVIVYIDNVVIRDGTPPNMALMFDFAWPESATAGVGSWGGGGGSVVVSQDASVAPLHPDGSLKLIGSYPGTTNWQDVNIQLNPYDWDPSKFTWLEFDLYLDAPTGQSTYGLFQVFQIKSDWGWQWIGGPGLGAANIGVWTHYKMPISSMTGSHGLVVQAGGGFTSAATMTYYLDNIKVWKPASPPSLTKLQRSNGAGGVQIIMDQNGNQWQRDAIVTPSTSSYSWVGQTPATYAFTITNFPDAAKYPGFEAHLYLANSDSGPGTWNQTYGGCDWNAADIAIMSLQNNTNGSVDLSFSWKTNLPGANPLTNAIYHPASITNLPSAMGTWYLTFNTDTSATLSGPGGVSTNFTLPADVPANNFNPSALFLQFGTFKNDSKNSGVNDQQNGTFSRVWMTNSAGGVFDDRFTGPGLTANYAWRTTSSTAVQWVPEGTALWLTWTTPDEGYSVTVAGNVSGTYNDAGVTYTYLQGVNRFGAVPAASIPAGDSAFFRLVKPGQ